MWGPSISLKCNHLPPFNPERRHPPFHRGPSMGFWGGFGEERKRGKREIETDASGRPSLLPRPLCTYLPWEHPPCLSLLRPPLPLPRLPITRPLPPPSPASVLASCNAPSLGSPLLPTFLLGLHHTAISSLFIAADGGGLPYRRSPFCHYCLFCRGFLPDIAERGRGWKACAIRSGTPRKPGICC